MENSVWNSLPTEIKILILKRLHFQDLLQCSLVCRDFAALADELIVKTGIFNIKYPFPARENICKLSRSYRTLTLIDLYFASEPDKIRNILEAINDNKTIQLTEIRLTMEEINVQDRMDEFFAFLKRNPQIRIVSLTSVYELAYNELIGMLTTVLPHVKVNILKKSEYDCNESFIDQNELESLQMSSIMSEISLLSILKTYPKLKRLQCHLRNDKTPKEVIKALQESELSKVSVEELRLSGIECIKEDTPSLNVFQNLKSLSLREGFDLGFEEEEESIDKYKFLQRLYSINYKTLRTLGFDGTVTSKIYNILPCSDVTLKLEHLSFQTDFRANHREEDSLKFVKLFVNQQLSHLKSIYIESLQVDNELMNLLGEIEHLEKLSLITCDLTFERVWPDFTNLKILDLTDSSVSCYSLQGMLSNNRIQNSLESLSLERIRPRKDMDNRFMFSSSYNFQKLKKLNLQNCNISITSLKKTTNFSYQRAPNQESAISLFQCPNLCVLSLAVQRNFHGILDLLTKLEKLEIIEIEVNSLLLIDLIIHLLERSETIKLARITCSDDFDEIMIDFLQSNFSKDFNKYPEFTYMFSRGLEGSLKLTNLSTTIIAQRTNSAFEEHTRFYENFMISLWH